MRVSRNLLLTVVGIAVGAAVTISISFMEAERIEKASRPIVTFCFGEGLSDGNTECEIIFFHKELSYQEVFGDGLKVIVRNTGKSEAPMRFTITSTNATLYKDFQSEGMKQLSFISRIAPSTDFQVLRLVPLRPDSDSINCYELNFAAEWYDDGTFSYQTAKKYGEKIQLGPTPVRLCLDPDNDNFYRPIQ